MSGTVTTPSASGSPLRAVLGAFETGASTLDDVAATTRLPRDVVDAVVEHLVRIGRLTASTLATGCPSGGCGTCASGVSGAPGCGAPAAGPGRPGPVLVALTLRREGWTDAQARTAGHRHAGG